MSTEKKATAGELTHLGSDGTARMVDVGGKPETERCARAAGELVTSPAMLELLRSGASAKGDIYTVAKVAGIQAAKRTGDLIPLCHPIPVSSVDVRFQVDEALPGVIVESEVRCHGRTGVEMEALTAVSVTLLTLYDMLKSADKRMRFQNIRLKFKSGGKSGDFVSD